MYPQLFGTRILLLSCLGTRHKADNFALLWQLEISGETSTTCAWGRQTSRVLAGSGTLLKPLITVHQCLYCSYKTCVKSNFLRHERIHTGEKPYPCPHCDFRCSQNSDLKKHIRIHTGEKPFACSYCPYRSSRKEVLKSHMRTHIGNRGNWNGSCVACEKYLQAFLTDSALVNTTQTSCLMLIFVMSSILVNKVVLQKFFGFLIVYI